MMTALVNWLQGIQGSAAIAGLALLLLVEHIHPFLDLFRGSRRAWSRHLARNLALSVANGLIVAVVFAGLWVLAAEWAAERGIREITPAVMDEARTDLGLEGM